MKIVMTQTKRGVKQGEIYPTTFLEGNTYDIEGSLLETFLNNGWANQESGSSTDTLVLEKPEPDLTGYTKRQLLAFAAEHELDVDESSRVADLQSDIISKYKAKLNGSE